MDFLVEDWAELGRQTMQHVTMVTVAVAVAVLVGVPAGIAVTRRRRLRHAVLGFANIVQTIPSLAIFGFLIPVPVIGGIGASTAVFALILYALLPIVRNTVVGIAGVDPAVREAGQAMGLTRWQLLYRVEVPLATAVILAGIRTAAIASVGIATIAAAIGAGGLGTYIFRGVASVNTPLILTGAVPAALLALLTDFLLGSLQHRFDSTAAVRPEGMPL